jgi:hypothetical protein
VERELIIQNGGKTLHVDIRWSIYHFRLLWGGLPAVITGNEQNGDVEGVGGFSLGSARCAATTLHMNVGPPNEPLKLPTKTTQNCFLEHTGKKRWHQ